MNVWVRSGISDRLGQLLAEQDDNVLHKPLTPLEAAGLYREIKALMAEDAARRQAATRFTTNHQPDADADGVGKFPTPSHQPKRSDAQAAAMIPGAPSYKTLDKIGWLHNLAADPTRPQHLRTQAAEGLAAIDAGAAVDPIYQHLHHPTGEDLDALATEALARVKAQQRNRKRPTPTPSVHSEAGKPPVRYSWRAFWAVWGDLANWWMHYDPADIAAKLTATQLDQFFATIDGTLAFAQQLRTHTHPNPRPAHQDEDTSAGQATVQLRLVEP